MEKEMKISPYLNFPGNCEEAFKFYEKTFGGKIEFRMTHGESPMAAQVEADWRDKIMHISLRIGDDVILGSDAPPQYQQKTQGFYISISLKDAAEAKRVFNALAENGQVNLAFSETFWSPGFGMLIDRFGIPWMVNTDQAAA
jgi:PhnB protein